MSETERKVLLILVGGVYSADFLRHAGLPVWCGALFGLLFCFKILWLNAEVEV